MSPWRVLPDPLSNCLRPQRGAVPLGLALGLGFGTWNVIASQLDPLADDTIAALLMFYGPMFATWALAAFVASRRTRRLIDGVKTGALVALVTFVVFTIIVIARVNLFLEVTTQRPDWVTLLRRFQSSGFASLRAFVNYEYITGAPFKIAVASTIGAVFGTLGGGLGLLSRRNGGGPVVRGNRPAHG